MNCVGIGKTTIAHELCLRWAKDGFLAEDFDEVILLQQRSLTDVVKTEFGKENYERLKKLAGRRCLIILEGSDELFDELSAEHRDLIKDCNRSEDAIMFTTSRPHACEDIDVYRRIDVVGFGKDKIREFAKDSFPNDIQSSVDFLKQLDEYPQLHDLCYVPLNFMMLLHVLNCSEKKLPSTFTELCQVFIMNTLINKENVKKKPVSPGEAIRVAAEYIEEMLGCIPQQTVGMVLCLCRAFFNRYSHMNGEHNWQRQWKVIFTESDLTQCNIELASDFDGFGLLKIIETYQLSMDVTYNFYHLPIQEFLFAVYISILSQQEQLCLLKEHFGDYPNVFTFTFDLTGLTSSKIFHFIYYKLISEYDLIIAMKCIIECKQNSTAHKLVSPLALDTSHYSLLPYNCLCLFSILSDDGMVVTSEVLQHKKSLTTLNCWSSGEGNVYAIYKMYCMPQTF